MTAAVPELEWHADGLSHWTDPYRPFPADPQPVEVRLRVLDDDLGPVAWRLDARIAPDGEWHEAVREGWAETSAEARGAAEAELLALVHLAAAAWEALGVRRN